jgi:Zn-dependent metalloprotease
VEHPQTLAVEHNGVEFEVLHHGEMTVRQLLTALCASIWAIGFAATSFAQGPSPEARRAIDQARQNNPGLSVKINPATGLPSSVSGLSPRSDPAAAIAAAREPTKQEIADAVNSWFATGELSAAFSLDNPTARYRATGPDHVFKDKDIPDQYVAEVVQQVDIEGYPAVPVFGSQAKVVVNGMTLGPTQLTSSISRVSIPNTPPRISSDDAIKAAREKLRQLAESSRNQPFSVTLPNSQVSAATAQLVVFDPQIVRGKGETAGPTRLAWLVSIATFRAFVDAMNNEVFFYYNDQPSANLQKVFDLAGSTIFPGSLVWDEQNSVRHQPMHADAERAFNHAVTVRAFFSDIFGRNGFDDSVSHPTSGQRANLESYVRYGVDENARWCTGPWGGCPKAHVMVYGPNYSGALDIVGHEMTHGVIKFEADLTYADESGAVNESLADIFGTLIEFHAGAGNWTMGEGLPGRSSRPLRDLANPHLSGPANSSLFNKNAQYNTTTNYGQPDSWTEFVKSTDLMCSSLFLQDNGCVHLNSGILNKFAYLISDGGTHNGVSVTGIGKVKLGRIAYRALVHHLTKSHKLQPTADAFVQACTALSALNVAGIGAADCVQVQKAQQAVGLDVPSS